MKSMTAGKSRFGRPKARVIGGTLQISFRFQLSKLNVLEWHSLPLDTMTGARTQTPVNCQVMLR